MALRRIHLVLSVCLLCLFVPRSSAQDAAPGAPAPLPGGEPTLDEVVVRPNEEPTTMPAPTREPVYQGGATVASAYPGLNEIEAGIGGLGDRPVFDMPELITVRGQERLTEMAPRTTPEALEEMVGVVVQRTNAGGGSVFLRGLTGNQILILIDGIRFNNSNFRFGPNQYLNTIDPGQIERIEVLHGPGSLLYGSDAIGGVVNIVTRSPEGIGLRTGLDGSLVQRFSTADNGLYSRLNVEGTFQRSGIFAGGSYYNVHDLDPGGTVPRQLYTGYEQGAGDIKFNYMINDRNMFTAAVQHLVQHDVPRTDRFVNSNEAYYFEPQERDLYYLCWQGLDLGGWIDAYRITASFNRQQEGIIRQRFGTTTRRRFLDDVQTTGVNLMAATNCDAFGRLTYGIDWYHDEVDSSAYRVDTATGAIGPERASYPEDSYYSRFGVYLQDEVPITRRLKGTGGVRYTNIQAGSTPLVGRDETPMHITPSFQDWTGSFGLVYEMTSTLHFCASASEGFRAPGLEDLTALTVTNQGVDVPSPDLGPETSWTYDVGVKANFDKLRMQVFGYWTHLDDLIVRKPIPGYFIDGEQAWAKQNAGQGRIDGIEVAGEYLLPRNLSVYGNFMYTHGRNVADSEPMDRIPPAQGLVGVRWRTPDRRSWFEIYEWLVARQDRLSARDEADPRIQDGGTPAWQTLNLRAGTFVWDNGLLSLGVENLLDQHYRVHASGIDSPGINCVLGYEVFY